MDIFAYLFEICTKASARYTYIVTRNEIAESFYTSVGDNIKKENTFPLLLRV